MNVGASIPLHGQGIPPEFLAGLKSIRAAQFQNALGVVEDLKRAFPQTAFGDVIAVEAYWSMIYCQTGHINGNEVWNRVDVKTSDYDHQFQSAVESAARLSGTMKKKKDTQALGFLLSGFVYAAQSRIHAFREQTLATANDAKRMRSELMEAAKIDSAFLPEVSVGLGSYDYYADALSPMLKVFRFFLGIPGGDKERGLRELRESTRQALYWRDTATFELARILGVREGKHAEALPLMKALSESYPGNGLYPLAAAFEAEGTGDRKAALELARKAMATSAKMELVCKVRLTQASESAVQRLSGSSRNGR